MKKNEQLKEFKEIKDIYNNIIKNYLELNLMLNINTPIEIFSFYILTLYNGYLSKTDNFIYLDNEDKLINCIKLKGADVLNGYGVCRHISAMLKDIYDNMGINNEILPIYLNQEKIKKKIFISNHVINIVSDNNRTILVDPTNSMIWEKVGKQYLMHINEENINIAQIPVQFDILNYNDYNINILKNIRNMLSRTSFSTKEDVVLLENTFDTFYKNTNNLQQLKNNNIKYYSEVTERLNTLKSKILIK